MSGFADKDLAYNPKEKPQLFSFKGSENDSWRFCRGLWNCSVRVLGTCAYSSDSLGPLFRTLAFLLLDYLSYDHDEPKREKAVMVVYT